MKILVTGSAGFIGSALVLRLLERGDEVVGIDNHNDYYDPTIKMARLNQFLDHPNYTHLKIDLSDHEAMAMAFSTSKPQRVVNLAAQAGVRYSIKNPMAYINSNIVGFTHILEGCRHNKVEHLVYASSSSVYGSNTSIPFSVHDNVDHPLSLYAATKKSNELMAHSYSNLFDLPTTGLRFFTVYGPWGRPDMALFLFTKNILENKPIEVFNKGNHSRDFTYIDDIVKGILLCNENIAKTSLDWDSNSLNPSESSAPFKVYNIGSSEKVSLDSYIEAIESELGKKAERELLPLQPGDIPDSLADISLLTKETGYKPETNYKEGVSNFIKWYKSYYGYK